MPNENTNPPEWLCADGKAEWLRVAGSVMGADVTTVAAYCQSYGRWREAERFLEENGTVLTVRDDKGVVKSIGQAPQVGVSARYLAMVVKLGRSLGVGAAVAKKAQSVAPRSNFSLSSALAKSLTPAA